MGRSIRTEFSFENYTLWAFQKASSSNFVVSYLEAQILSVAFSIY